MQRMLQLSAAALLSLSPAGAVQGVRDATIQAEHWLVPVTDTPDSVPLPTPRVFEAGPAGDQVIAPAGGDPFFLGFAGGDFHPPEGERVDPALAALAAQGFADGRPGSPSEEVFGFVMFAQRITRERLSALELAGARVLKRHPHHAVGAATRVDRVDQIASLPFVHWIGLPRAWQKVHPVLEADLGEAAAGEEIELWVSLFDSDLSQGAALEPGVDFEPVDPTGTLPAVKGAAPATARSGGWRERELEQLGFEPIEYVDTSHSFRLRTDRDGVDRLTALDFVKFLSPNVEARALHDESMAMLSADLTRASWDGGVDQEVIVAVVDSGITAGHVAFNGSWSLGVDFTVEALGAWVDSLAHGTHVAGTIFGRPDLEDSWAGAAPGIASWGPTGRFWNLKIIDSTNSVNVNSWAAVYATMSTPWVDGGGQITPIPHILNHSWGSASIFGGWVGTESQAVDWDTMAYDNDQLHVFAAGNNGPILSSLSIQASAKNTLAVGNVMDHEDAVVGMPGQLWQTSSRGPTADGRWRPNVVAPGHMVRSADANNITGYFSGQGTSMAAPHVTGVAAQLLDHYPFLRHRPHTTAALLMATALTKDDASIVFETDNHLVNYGAGRIEAHRAHYADSQFETYMWGWENKNGGKSIEVDVLVTGTARRLTVVMHYLEPAASVGASQALVNNWDLWIDQMPFEPGSNTGEFISHQSSVSNTEIRMIDTPQPDLYRFKLHPEDVSDDCHLGLAIIIEHGDTTPDGTLALTAGAAYAQPDEEVDIQAVVTNPEHVASAVFLDSTSSAQIKSATLTLKDGATADLTGNWHGGEDVMLGNILAGDQRSLDWTISWPGEGNYSFQVDALSDNWVDESQQVNVLVDGTGPGLAPGLTSTTHATGTWSSNGTISYYWNPAPDTLSLFPGSGTAGYSHLTGPAPTLPPPIQQLGPVTTYTEQLASSASPYYFNLRAVDNARNWASEYATAGPFLIDRDDPSAPGASTSTSHTPGQGTCKSTMLFHWGPANDQHSGVKHYLFAVDVSPATQLTSAASSTVGLSLITAKPAGSWYLHVAAEDLAGNVGPTTHFGPVVIEDPVTTVYCKVQTNTLGCKAVMSTTGCASLSGGSGIDVQASNLLNQKSAILFWGLAPDNKPFGGGTKCVKNPVVRTPLQNTGGLPFLPNCTGSAGFLFTPAYMTGKGLVAGDTVHCQVWSRDPSAAGGGTNLSGGLSFLVRP